MSIWNNKWMKKDSKMNFCILQTWGKYNPNQIKELLPCSPAVPLHHDFASHSTDNYSVIFLGKILQSWFKHGTMLENDEKWEGSLTHPEHSFTQTCSNAGEWWGLRRMQHSFSTLLLATGASQYYGILHTVGHSIIDWLYNTPPSPSDSVRMWRRPEGPSSPPQELEKRACRALFF